MIDVIACGAFFVFMCAWLALFVRMVMRDLARLADTEHRFGCSYDKTPANDHN